MPSPGSDVDLWASAADTGSRDPQYRGGVRAQVSFVVVVIDQRRKAVEDRTLASATR